MIGLEFLKLAALSCTYLSALAELARHLVEGLMRHKDRNETFLNMMETFFLDLLPEASNPYEKVRVREEAEQSAQLRYLAKAMMEGLTWSKEPFKERPVILDVYFIGRTPWISSGPFGKSTQPAAESPSMHDG